MGFREEIEKLYPHFCIGLIKSDVLSILDEWECVGDKQFPDDDLTFSEMYDFVLDVYEATKPGDHISIYVRRSHEDKLD